MSSDSEDDCYGNVSEKLQKMKDKFLEDKTDTLDLVNDSTELDELVKICSVPPASPKKRGRKPKNDASSSSVFDLPDVSLNNSPGNSTKRVTRSKAKRCATTTTDTAEAAAAPAPTKKQKKTTTKNATNATENTMEMEDPESIADVSRSSTSSSRGRRGRGGKKTTPKRGRRGRGGWRQRMWLPTSHNLLMDLIDAMAGPAMSNNLNTNIPIYSIGNTDEYTDQSDNQPLFSKKQTAEDVVLVEENNMEDNEELSVKVYWQNSEFFKFTIRRFQKFTQIFDYFAKKENVTHDKLFFTFNDKILKPDDTPDSIDYSIVKFIDGGIVTQAVDLAMKDEEIKDGVKLKFQCHNLKKPFEISIRLDDKLLVAMMKCAEHLEKPLDKLKFEFDGDSISGKSTAREQDFEGGECIDVRIIN